MCVICASKKGVRQPSVEEIKAMYSHNPHGAGYMYARDGKVIIHKGFMSLKEFERAIDQEHFTKDDAVVYHFRISTQAGVKPEATHPFPLTKKIEQTEILDLECPCGVAHNGIIRLTSNGNPDYSDTQLFIAKYMSHIVRSNKDLHDESIIDILDILAGSKLAILDNTGYIATVGDFFKVKGEKDSPIFSNMHWAFPTTGYNRRCSGNTYKNKAQVTFDSFITDHDVIDF